MIHSDTIQVSKERGTQIPQAHAPLIVMPLVIMITKLMMVTSVDAITEGADTFLNHREQSIGTNAEDIRTL